MRALGADGLLNIPVSTETRDLVFSTRFRLGDGNDCDFAMTENRHDELTVTEMW
jgi:hypothetical protein